MTIRAPRGMFVIFERFLFVLALLAAAPVRGEDWPMWRHDAQRTAWTAEKLPDRLHLQWVREYPPLEPAWPDQVEQGFLTFDVSYKPVVMGKRLFVGSSRNHTLTALDTETGNEVWRFYAGGPIRFAPVAWKGKVYFACDDGYLYCLSASDGSLRWKLRGGPDDRKIIGNGHLVSAWPARGAPVLADGVIYFGASIWPFMGSFLYAVDAETGKIVWANSGIGAEFKPSYSYQGSGMLVRPGLFGGVPQGYLTVAGDRLAVPQGRNIPQIFDRATGKLVFHEIFGMHPGDSTDHWYALTAGRRVFSGRPGSAFARSIPAINIDTLTLADANPSYNGITGEKAIYHVSSGGVRAVTAMPPFSAIWQLGFNVAAAPTCAGSYIRAGDSIYVAGAGGQLLVVKDVDTDKRSCVVGPKIPGKEVWDMLAADGKLFVVTRDGKIACFGGRAGEAKMHAHKVFQMQPPAGRASQVAEILKATGRNDGYCLVLGVQDYGLIAALLANSKLKVIAVDGDEKKVAALRVMMDYAGLYGERFSAHVGEPLNFGFPPYLADLIVSETLDDSALGEESARTELMRILRPYGGTICLAKPGGGYELVVRRGGPPGSAEWTHSNADAGNTMFSPDKLVRPPLGVLWFGGPPNTPILPRHGHGPSPQVAAGRLFIEGRDLLRAIDIYTGRLLWERTFKDLGVYYDTGGKQAGAHETGANYASAADGVYVITPQKCLELDPATGNTTKEFAPPAGLEAGSLWGSIRVTDDLLIATLRPMDKGNVNARQGSGSQVLAVYERKSGKALWTRKAEYSFRQNSVIAAPGKVFCIDSLTPGEIDALKRRGQAVAAKPCIYALRGRTGEVVWKSRENVFGTWLGYSAERDVLVQAGSSSYGNEPTALAAYRAADGKLLWKSPPAETNSEYKFVGPPMLHHDVIIPQFGRVVGLMDGKLRTRLEPLTGNQAPWTATAQGCGFTNACEYLLLHRAWSHGGYTVVSSAPRMVGLGGFRSSCTANMIPAGGILTVPDYTRTCQCQFKNQTSLALIHMPEADAWSFELNPPPTAGRIKRLGLNFGAPADRAGDDGTLWLDCPDVGGPSPRVDVALAPSKEGFVRDWLGDWRGRPKKAAVFAGTAFRCHSSAIESGPLKWVAGSGISGVTGVRVGLVGGGAKDTATYTVRLYFAEPKADAKAGDRVFSVSLQGREVLKDFDVVKAAGGPRRCVVREFKGVQAGDALELKFAAKAGEALICGLELMAQE